MPAREDGPADVLARFLAQFGNSTKRLNFGVAKRLVCLMSSRQTAY